MFDQIYNYVLSQLQNNQFASGAILAAKENVIVIITTNHPELLDGALTRKGRMDKVIHIPNPSALTIDTYLSDYFDKPNMKRGPYRNICFSEVQDIVMTSATLEEALKLLK